MPAQQLPQIDTQQRDRLGSRYAARLRTNGRLPVVVYGHKKETLHVSVDTKKLTDILRHDAKLIEVVFDSETEPCLVKDVQWDHLGARIIHVDLTRVDLSEQVEVDVTVELVGESKALEQEGTVLEQPLTSVQVRCRADQIPDRIRHDISDLVVGHPVTVNDLELPEAVAAVSDIDSLVAQITIVHETPEEQEALEPTAAGEEPEVIGKGGKEEPGAEGKGNAEATK